jgi:hypothetical protein
MNNQDRDIRKLMVTHTNMALGVDQGSAWHARSSLWSDGGVAAIHGPACSGSLEFRASPSTAKIGYRERVSGSISAGEMPAATTALGSAVVDRHSLAVKRASRSHAGTIGGRRGEV